MPPSLTRRALLGALVGGGPLAASLSPLNTFLEGAAPLSGSAWGALGDVPDTVESEYGSATVTYDDYHVPHVEADSEAAAYFAVGYAQAADRLAQMDLLRRRAEGTLAALVGESWVDSDEFKTKMDFPGAAEAAREAIAGTDTERMTQAYADGVNAYIDSGPAGLAYGLLDVEPRAWAVRDTLLVVVEMGWLLTGSFDPLRETVKRQTFDEETREALYPDRYDHGAPILRPGRTGGEVGGVEQAVATESTAAVAPEYVEWLSQFEGPEWAGSNAWTVSGEFTESGNPILCSDPHLRLQVPPVWYQQHVTTDDVNVRGVVIPGTPFVTIGETDHCAWGITNVGLDAVDCYSYETRTVDGDQQYRYRGEWRAFETGTRTVEVADGEDRTVEVKKTVHGPYLERETGEETFAVGVSWTGLGGVRDALAVHDWSRAESVAEIREATRTMDLVSQNVHAVDADGNTLYQLSGTVPIRRVDGDVVRGNRIFDGSAGEAEWEGFEPYGQSSWDGFVPFEDQPGVRNPDYVASANQRTADDPTYPIADSFAPGFRGVRIYEVLDDLVDGGTEIDVERMQSLQLDTLSVRARMLVPKLLDARDRMPDDAEDWLDALAEWDYRMDRDSEAALVFTQFHEQLREQLWTDFFEERGLSRRYWPSTWVDVTLPTDTEFADGDLPAVMATALEAAIEEIESEGWETYGDYNVTGFDHPLGFLLPELNYTRHPTDGGALTVRRFNTGGPDGASYRLVAEPGGESVDVLPGGNSGSVFSDHYADQLQLWADGEYKRHGTGGTGDPDITVEDDG